MSCGGWALVCSETGAVAWLRSQRRAAGINQQWIVAEQTERSDITSGRERGRNIIGTADVSDARQPVHVRLARGLQRRFAAERLLRFISAAVGNDDRVFHENS